MTRGIKQQTYFKEAASSHSAFKTKGPDKGRDPIRPIERRVTFAYWQGDLAQHCTQNHPDGKNALLSFLQPVGLGGLGLVALALGSVALNLNPHTGLLQPKTGAIACARSVEICFPDLSLPLSVLQRGEYANQRGTFATVCRHR